MDEEGEHAQCWDLLNVSWRYDEEVLLLSQMVGSKQRQRRAYQSYDLHETPEGEEDSKEHSEGFRGVGRVRVKMLRCDTDGRYQILVKVVMPFKVCLLGLLYRAVLRQGGAAGVPCCWCAIGRDFLVLSRVTSMKP